MALNQQQIIILQEFRKRLRSEIKTYNDAPDDIKVPLDELWQAFKSEANFDDDNQADLAGFGALSQLALLTNEIDDLSIKQLISLFATSILVKVKKGDQLD